jgi:hypothetical protein
MNGRAALEHLICKYPADVNRVEYPRPATIFTGHIDAADLGKCRPRLRFTEQP